MKKLLFLIAIYSITSASLMADAGTTSAAFLKVGIGARNLAMGGVGAVEKSADSIYYNPAGLGFIDSKEISFMHLNWFAGISFDYLAFAMPYGKWGFAASYENVLYGNITEYDANDTMLNNYYSPNDSLATLAAAYRLKDNLSVGLSAKYINSNIETVSATAVAGDAGLIYSPDRHFDVGFAVQNFGGTLTYVQDGEALPLNIKAGAGYYLDPIKGITPKFYLDVNQPVETVAYVGLGAECNFQLKDGFGAALRVGYRTQTTDNGVNGLSAGCGLNVNHNIILDFAWVPYGDYGDTYSMSLKFRFQEMFKDNKVFNDKDTHTGKNSGW